MLWDKAFSAVMRCPLNYSTILIVVACLSLEAAAVAGEPSQKGARSSLTTVSKFQPGGSHPVLLSSRSSLATDRALAKVVAPVHVVKTRRTLARWLRGDSVAQPRKNVAESISTPKVTPTSPPVVSARFSTERGWRPPLR